ncbi:hypothetical protein L227DRAFT_575604 [Lentinus tigrinus ALCF2SS1-6]|uniref:Endonuclease/exonuclease/phosphatase domain-containing protein n=2 Tax=Lentinus tigrinus TaxID=5365 RepID=A0A5C2S9Y3_9APHY|nr:hypothetical protein L227DRAFT_575604 [Lentinus tigrinus ALCF2SS1-6]
MAIANDQNPEVLEHPQSIADLELEARRDSQPHDDTDDDLEPTATGTPQVSQPHASGSHPTPALSPTSSSSDSPDDEDDFFYDMTEDILRPLRVKGFSPEDGRWTTKYPSCDTPVFALRLVSWNVDFVTPDPAGRMARILHHLQDWVLMDCPKPSCILLQELTEESFEALLENTWVQEHFVITPPNTKRWQASYGLATLVSRHARVRNAQMLQFHRTTMGRGAIFVDVEMFVPGSMGETRIVRIANTHLESLPEGERSRPAQLRAIAGLLRQKTVTGGGVVGGDMNMIGPADQDIHIRAGLVDGCVNPTLDDYTWGWQPPTWFPPGRLDRFFFREDGIEWRATQVIGRDVKTQGTGQWVSDHYGLTSTIHLAAATKNTCPECTRH